MSNFFGTHFKTGAAQHMLRLYGETVTYYFDGAVPGVARQAIVVRNPLAVMAELGQQVGPAVIVKFLDDSEQGIAYEDVNEESDLVEVGLEQGETPSRRQVTQILSNEAGWTRLLVQ
jgi:hypothetical protein